MSNSRPTFTLPAPAAALAAGLTLLIIAYLYERTEFASDRAFWGILRQDDLPVAWVMLVFLTALAGLTGKLPARLGALPRFFAAHPLAVSIATTAALALLTLLAYHNQPLSMDEYAPWFQAKAFAAGALNGRFPTELMDRLISKPFHGVFFTVDVIDGRVASSYWPGYALLLTPFMALGLPWLCNPLIVGLSCLMTWRLARDIFDSREAAGWALMLAACSPAFTLLGMSYYSMSAHLLANLAFAWLLFRPSLRRAFLAGLIGGLALALHNPYPHLVFALPFTWWLWRFPKRWHLFLALAAGYLVLTPPLVLGWVTFKNSFVATLPAAAALGASGATPPSLAESIQGIVGSLFSAPDRNIVSARLGGFAKLWLWASPLLVMLAILGTACTKRPFLRVLAASAISTLLAYFVIRFDQGMGWGYRYFHPAWGVLPILATAWLFDRGTDAANAEHWKPMLVVASLAGLLIFTPLHAYNMEQRVSSIISQVPPDIEGRSLKIMRGKGYCYWTTCDILQNDPFLRGNVILLNRLPARDQTIIARHFPGAAPAADNDYGVTYRLPATEAEQRTLVRNGR